MYSRNKPRKPKPTENRNSGRISGPAPAVFVVYCDDENIGYNLHYAVQCKFCDVLVKFMKLLNN